MQEFFQQIINGLSVGAVYALIAVGYTMVYGVLRFINFAHGDVFMLGAMVALLAATKWFHLADRSPWIALPVVLLVAMILCGLFGFLVERFCYRPLRNQPRLTVLILARVVDKLGDLVMVTPHEIEGLFAADLAFLQDFYGVINFGNQEEYEALLAAQAASAPLIGVPPPAPARANGFTASASESPPADDAASRPVQRARVEEIPRVPV